MGRRPVAPFILSNADILTKVNVSAFLEFHSLMGGVATMLVRKEQLAVPFGVVDLDETKQTVIGLSEKPVFDMMVNAGMYVFDPIALDFVEKGVAIDAPDLLGLLRETSKGVKAFPLHEYWIDIGRKETFNKAKEEWQTL